MSVEKQFNEALSAEHPLWGLREVVQSLLAQGQEHDALIAALERFRGSLHDTGRDKDEDIVLEIMDFLTGLCSPHMKL